MAETEFQSERLRDLAVRAADSRRGLSDASRRLKVASDFGQRVQTSIRGNLFVWLGTAAVVGLVLAKLPARRKKIYVGSGVSPTAETAKGGLLLATAGLLFKIFRPFLQKILVEQIGVLAEKHFSSRTGKSPR